MTRRERFTRWMLSETPMRILYFGYGFSVGLFVAGCMTGEWW